jgi:HEAT repeat protein
LAVAALGKNGQDARAALERALNDEAPSVRIEAANTLFRLGDRQALDALARELDHESPTVVMHAARTIELLGTEARAAAPAMRKALERSQEDNDVNLFVKFSAEAFLKSLR